jgi:hypothetical protein
MSKGKHAGRSRQLSIRRALHWAKLWSKYAVPAADIASSIAVWIGVFKR